MSSISHVGLPPISRGRIEPAGRQAEATQSDRGGERLRLVRGEDQVEVSDMAFFLSKLRELPEVRQELIDRVRAEIDSGGYETSEKIDWAIEQFGGELRA